MTPPGWDEEEDSWSDEESEESSYSDSYGDKSFGDEEDEFYDDDFVETPSEGGEEDDLETMISEGEALIEEGEYQQALDLFVEAAERFNENPLAIFHVGQTYLMLFGDMVETDQNWKSDDEIVSYKEEAESAFETALSLDEEYYPALNGLGSLALLTGDGAEAVEYWSRSLEIAEDQDEIKEGLKEAKTLLK